jgi:ZIP family zinc transporter
VVGEAALWGLLAGSSLLIGGVIGLRLGPGNERAVGLLLGFGSGVLISAVAYELVEEAFKVSEGSAWTGVGLAVGALTYYTGDRLIQGHGRSAHSRKSAGASHDVAAQEAIVLGTVLDGIPEGIVLGMSLIGGGGASIAIIAAVFLSNLPEAVGATSGLRRGGRSPKVITRMWVTIMLLTALASVVGFALFDDASGALVAFTQSFAGGALLTMVAGTMLPAAYHDAGGKKMGGEIVGLMTVLGFAVAFGLTQLG